MKPAHAIIPGTSANLGPGYDCLGIALDIHNTVRVAPADTPPDPHPMADQAITRFFHDAAIPPRPVRWTIEGMVPPSRGLGSSVTLRLGLLAALNAAHGDPLDPPALYKACSDLEGHPDNAAPAQFGGFITALPDTTFLRFEVSERLHFVLLVPEFEIQTDHARETLPATVPRADAVHNVAQVSFTTAAFASGRYELLRHAFRDRLHQPYRAPLLPGMHAAIKAGQQAGALGGFLSGSGSTICCVTLEHPDKVGEAMRLALDGTPARVITTACSNSGARAAVTRADSSATALP